MNLVLCVLLSIYVICHIILCVQLSKILNLLINLNFPWDKIEQLTNAWQSQTTKTGVWTGADAIASQSIKATSLVEELPPEVIAPSLKKMRRTSGFGSNPSDKNSDT